MNSIPGVASTLDYDVDKKVDASISAFLTSLSQIGPELLSVSKTSKKSSTCVVGVHFSFCLANYEQTQGGLTLSFFERRATRQLFGLVSNEEKVVYV